MDSSLLSRGSEEKASAGSDQRKELIKRYKLGMKAMYREVEQACGTCLLRESTEAYAVASV